MIPSIDHLAQRLIGEFGADAVSTDAAALTAHAVDGQVADIVCRPAARGRSGGSTAPLQ